MKIFIVKPFVTGTGYGGALNGAVPFHIEAENQQQAEEIAFAKMQNMWPSWPNRPQDRARLSTFVEEFHTEDCADQYGNLKKVLRTASSKSYPPDTYNVKQ
jgi:hypothetical protein